MWASIFLVCGLNIQGNPNIVEECGLQYALAPVKTEAECMRKAADYRPELQYYVEQDGGYISDHKCVHLSRGA